VHWGERLHLSNMCILSKNIIDTFYGFLIGKIPIHDFEKWVYDSSDLENELDEISYYDFISFGFKKSGAKYELEQLIKKHINISEYETWKLKGLLFNALERKNNYYDSIQQIYELYFNGYDFLDNLGLGYGITLDCLYFDYGVETFEDLPKKQKDYITKSFYPEIQFEIKKVLNWFDSGLIVLDSEYDSRGCLKVTDNRKETEKEPSSYKIEKTTDKKNNREWWKIWK
jgi:hypothetical protein